MADEKALTSSRPFGKLREHFLVSAFGIPRQSRTTRVCKYEKARPHRPRTTRPGFFAFSAYRDAAGFTDADALILVEPEEYPWKSIAVSPILGEAVASAPVATHDLRGSREGSLMAVRSKELGWLLTQVVADLPETREEAASVTVDWEPALSDFQKRLLVRTLVLVASVEASDQIRETQLNAISELFRPPLMTKGDVAPLFEISAEVLNDQDRDYLDGLLEALAEFPGGVEGPA